jgi:hypothetical protein
MTGDIMVSKQHTEASNVRKSQLLNYVLSLVVVVLVLYILYDHNLLTPLGISKPQPFGNTTAGINTPFNAASLAVINDANNTKFEIAGNMLLNGTLTDPVYYVNKTSGVMGLGPYVVGGKPSVIYIGAISCIYCGENRWAMALALSRFGSFKNLYTGYSSIGDGDIPTIYWLPMNYTTKAGVKYGNEYTSNYINFYSVEYESPISEGFQMGSLQMLISSSPNGTYKSAMQLMNSTNKFQGTPFTMWGNVVVPGADGIVFGNTTPSGSIPLTYMTHAEVISQFSKFNNQFAYGEYAAADVYISYICPSINNSAPVCSLAPIKKLEQLESL